MQKPWKHSACGPVAASRSSCTSPSLGMRLKTTKRTSRAASSRRPTARFFLRAVSKIAPGSVASLPRRRHADAAALSEGERMPAAPMSAAQRGRAERRVRARHR